MLRVAIDPYNDNPLRCALMACVKPAGGDHLTLAGQGHQQVGHLIEEQVRSYVAELGNYSRDHPMPDGANADKLAWILNNLGSGKYGSVIILQRGNAASLYASVDAYAFNGVVAAGHGIPAAVAVYDGLMAELYTRSITAD